MVEYEANDGARGLDARILRAVSRLITSRPLLVNLALVVWFCGYHVFELSLLPEANWLPLAVGVPATCTLLLRRRMPWMVFGVLITAVDALTLMKEPIGCLNLATLVAVYTVCSRTSNWGAVLVAGLAMSLPVAEFPSYGTSAEAVLNILGAFVHLVMTVAWGIAMRIGRERASQLEQTLALLDQARDQLAVDAAVTERSRIAREFHDIVSHNLSVVALRAGVARALVDREPEHARDTLRELEQSSRSALGEMRNLLSALRDGADGDEDSPGDQDQRERRPAPGLQRVDSLVERVQGAGVVWRLDRRGTVRELGPGLEMTAYRIVQEAITNVLKHAGFGHARVLLDYGTNALSIEITNHISGAKRSALTRDSAPKTSSSGHGLIGLRERVALLGGTLAAHPVPNGFHVAAVLPCPENSDLS
jgi:signal transduction histidine kinase